MVITVNYVKSIKL